MTNPDPDLNEQPDTGHPPWCEMDVAGRHVGGLTLAAQMDGYDIFAGPLDFGADGIGLQVIVANTTDGERTSRVEIEPRLLDEAATVAAFKEILDSIDDTEGEAR
jgi:hypothetical protein